MAVYIRPFRKSDLDAFEPIERGLLRSDGKFAQIIEDSGLSITGIREGKVIGCGGVHPTDKPEQGELWLRLSHDCLKYKLDTLRWLRDALVIVEETYGFKQLNATIRCGFRQSIKLVKSLGFVQTQERTEDGQKWCVFSKLVKT